MMRGALSAVFVLLAAPLQAAELLDIDVEYEDGVYTMVSTVHFNAPLENMFTVFRSWEYSEQFSSTIVESRDMAPDAEGRPQYFSKMRGCVLFFCKSFVRQGSVELEQNRLVRAIANPETSDFKLVEEEWTFSVVEDGTVVVYDLRFTPDFWVPPGIGPYFIKRKLKNDGSDAIDRIEAIALNLDNDE